MTRKRDNALNLRVSDDIAEKLDTILDAQNSLLEKMGVPQMTKTLFMEKLIHDEYINYLNKDKDPETTDRINRMIDSRLELAIRNRDKYLQEILFESRKTNVLLNLLLEKQGMNVHNTEVVESIENKSELEAVVDRLIAKKVFGASNVLEVESKVKTDEDGEQKLSANEIQMILQDYYDEA